MFGSKFFVTVTSKATEKKTSSISTKGTAVQWNEILDALYGKLFWSSFLPLMALFSNVQPSSRLVLRLYAERFGRRDILIGTHEMIPIESRSGSFLI